MGGVAVVGSGLDRSIFTMVSHTGGRGAYGNPRPTEHIRGGMDERQCNIKIPPTDAGG